MYKIRVYKYQLRDIIQYIRWYELTYDHNRTSWQYFEQSNGIFIFPFSLTFKKPSTATLSNLGRRQATDPLPFYPWYFTPLIVMTYRYSLYSRHVPVSFIQLVTDVRRLHFLETESHSWLESPHTRRLLSTHSIIFIASLMSVHRQERAGDERSSMHKCYITPAS